MVATLFSGSLQLYGFYYYIYCPTQVPFSQNSKEVSGAQRGTWLTTTLLSDKQRPLRSESGEIGSAISDKDQLAGTPRPA